MSGFIAKFSGVYEHSPWVAERVLDAHGELDDIDQIETVMVKIVDNASVAEKLELILGHPELAVSQSYAGQLTSESRQEQQSAGLDNCSSVEVERFNDLNKKYTGRFGFPFVMAVWGKSRSEILAAFETRLNNNFDTEFSNAINEIHKIAAMRLHRLEMKT